MEILGRGGKGREDMVTVGFQFLIIRGTANNGWQSGKTLQSRGPERQLFVYKSRTCAGGGKKLNGEVKKAIGPWKGDFGYEVVWEGLGRLNCKGRKGPNF